MALEFDNSDAMHNLESYYNNHSNELYFELFLIQNLSLSKIPIDILTKFDINYEVFKKFYTH